MKLENTGGYLAGLNAGDLIKTNGEQGALRVVSQQFEAQFLQTVLKQMRSASDAMADEDSPFSSKNDGLYRDLHDAELAMQLSKLQTMGLSEVMTKQLSGALKSNHEAVALDLDKQHNQPAMTTTAMQPALIMPKFSKDTP
ncbi:rod-binding protein [Shewanella sp. SR44-3]|uniref:rod-binding protein n=1 Tax=unclassified Shewanella TaxID=196818 RepID=UPI0015FD21D8|nr:rod-binding protein [Shewanella sp. SR44-3]MBB1268392.1 rod-binding protein [Shewanella sp. SR44-3]